MSEEKNFGFGFSEEPKVEKVEEVKVEKPKPKKEKKVEVEVKKPEPVAEVSEVLYGAAKLRAKRAGRG